MAGITFDEAFAFELATANFPLTPEQHLQVVLTDVSVDIDAMLYNSYADAARSQDVAHAQLYHRIKAALTDMECPTHEIELLLESNLLTNSDIRKLFGSLRKAFLNVLWQHREREIWNKRAKIFGVDYAECASLENSVASLPGRLAFYRDMDEQFEMAGSSKESFKTEIVQHAKVYRETCEGLDLLGAQKVEIQQEEDSVGEPRLMRLE